MPKADSPPKMSNAVCLGCGALCDDLDIHNAPDGSLQIEPPCAVGQSWFDRNGLVDAQPTHPYAQGVETAERIARGLLTARSPLIFGLSQASTESARAAFALADRVRGGVWLDRTVGDRARALAYQNVGRVTGTLGETKNRSDLIVVWGCDPLRTHPRHSSRYSFDAEGRFLPNGRAGRTLIVIDEDSKSETAKVADLFLALDPGRTLEFVGLLRLLLKGKPTASSTFSRLGFDRDVLEGLVQRFRSASHGTIFFKPPEGSLVNTRILWESVLGLVRDLNDSVRFAVHGLGAEWNLPGVESALTWQTGQLLGVDFRLGFPRPWPTLLDLSTLLERSEIDFLLVIGDRLPNPLTTKAKAALATIPCYRVGPRRPNDSLFNTEDEIETATFGIDSGGTATRADGVALPVSPVLATNRHSEVHWIEMILENVVTLSRGDNVS